MRRLLTIIIMVLQLAGLIFSQSTNSSEGEEYMQVIADVYSLIAPDEIPTGWITIEFENSGDEPHLMRSTQELSCGDKQITISNFFN